MNKIEQRFYDAWNDYSLEYESDTGHKNPNDYYIDNKIPMPAVGLEPQVTVGIYRVDFVLGERLIVEIDGHESHKTKEQRYLDCKRDRFLVQQGYVVIRFTASEVFLNARQCLIEATTIADAIETIDRDNFLRGLDAPRKAASKL